MEHYYSKNPHVKSDRRYIDFDLEGVSLRFLTDAGVFSKTRVDYGTEIMIKTLLKGGYIESGKLLDIGCGYGPIGITIAKSNKNINVTMTDINERAIELCKENIASNGVSDRCNVYESDSFENISGKFNYIITNPPIRQGKGKIYQMFDEAFEHLEYDGSIYVVIQKKQGADSAKKKLSELFGNCTSINIKGGYHILESKKTGR